MKVEAQIIIISAFSLSWFSKYYLGRLYEENIKIDRQIICQKFLGVGIS